MARGGRGTSSAATCNLDSVPTPIGNAGSFEGARALIIEQVPALPGQQEQTTVEVPQVEFVEADSPVG